MGLATVGNTKRKSRATDLSPAGIIRRNIAPNAEMSIIERIRSGVTRKEWKELLHKINATEKEMVRIIPTSLSSMQKKKVYGQEASERIYQLARLYSLGFSVFDSQEDFKSWLKTPSRALGYKKPFDLLDSSIGFELVRNAILRIQYNVYS